MSFNDFIKTWDRIYLCHLTCDSFIDHLDKAGQVSLAFKKFNIPNFLKIRFVLKDAKNLLEKLG